MVDAKTAWSGESVSRRTERKALSADCEHCLLLKSLRAAKCTAETTSALCQRMWLSRVKRRQILYSEGNRAVQLFALRSGAVKLVTYDAGGREHVTSILQSGDLFGFEALFGEAYLTGAEALSDSEICVASHEELRDMLAAAPNLALDFARYLHRQLVQARERQAFLGVLGARARLAGYLLHRLAGRPDAATVSNDLTLDELGGLLGLAPETVCRALAELRSRGVIETGKAQIEVRDVGELRRVARR